MSKKDSGPVIEYYRARIEELERPLRALVCAARAVDARDARDLARLAREAVADATLALAGSETYEFEIEADALLKARTQGE